MSKKLIYRSTGTGQEGAAPPLSEQRGRCPLPDSFFTLGSSLLLHNQIFASSNPVKNQINCVNSPVGQTVRNNFRARSTKFLFANSVRHRKRAHSRGARGLNSRRRIFNRQALRREQRQQPFALSFLVQLREPTHVTIGRGLAGGRIFSSDDNRKQRTKIRPFKHVTDLRLIRHA